MINIHIEHLYKKQKKKHLDDTCENHKTTHTADAHKEKNKDKHRNQCDHCNDASESRPRSKSIRQMIQNKKKCISMNQKVDCVT